MKLLKTLLTSSAALLKMSNFNTFSSSSSSSSSLLSSSSSILSQQFQVVDIDKLNDNEYYNIFSYGSNSISQLRGRTANNNLTSEAAYVNDVIRIFVLSGWGGKGVASLHRLKDEETKGSLVSMNVNDLKKLNIYEEQNYNLCEIEVNRVSDNKQINALTYIAKNPAYSKFPSEEYCVAIKKHLQENNHQLDALTIFGYNPDKGEVEKKGQWVHPGIPNLSIPGLFVEVNVERNKQNASPWIMPSKIYEIETMLDRININTVDDLQVAVHQGNLNQLLKDADLQQFDDATINILGSFFYNYNPSTTNVDLATDNTEHYCFVYGSLLKDLSNHYFLKDHSSTVLVGKGTTINKYYLTGRIRKEFPYLTTEPLLSGQTENNIRGEVYKVSSTCLYQLDRLENHPNWYVREKIRIVLEDDKEVEANAYFLRKETDLERIKSNPTLFENVTSGDWRYHGGI